LQSDFYLQGIQLANEQSKGTFTFFNQLSEPYIWTKFNPIGETDSSGNCTFPPYSSSVNDNPFKALYQKIEQDITKHKTTGSCIIIDNINTFLNFSEDLNDVLEFVHYCQVLVETTENSNLIILIHEDEDEQSLTAIAHKADMIFSIEELETGYSKDITGQISILFNTGSKPKPPIYLHFKTTEKII